MPAVSLLTLLQAVAQGRTDLPLAGFSEPQVRWAITAGLGPWLRRCTAGDPDVEASPLWPLVHGADLTARVIVAEQLDALEEIVVDCEPYAGPITLLKGISISEQHYAEPHLRTMGDIDILVDEADLAAVQNRLLRLGYRPESSRPAGFYETHHHVRPMFHPRRHVWVEVHRDLFPVWLPIGREPLFSRDRVRTQLVASSFRGRPVQRLSDGLQLVYTASHWAIGLRRTSGTVGILDVLHLLKGMPTQCWLALLTAPDTRMAASHVYLLLTYLQRRGLAAVEPQVLRTVARHQRALGPGTVRALHAMVDRYIVAGDPLGWLMSPRNFEIVWTALLLPGPPSRNVLRLGWQLLPSRTWLRRALRRTTGGPA